MLPTKENSESNKKHRDSSIELLRIIAMIMIVFHHFAFHGKFEWDASELSLPRFWYHFIVMGGKVGVDIFVLISGFFLIKSEILFDIKKILKFWGQVFFYSISIYFLFVIIGVNDLSLKSLVSAFFPITFGDWRFASAYFVLFLIHPFLNKLLLILDKVYYQYLIILLIVCWSIIPTFTSRLYESNSLLWFITLYTIAGYIRMFGLNPNFKLKHYVFLFCGISVLTYISSVTFILLGTHWEVFAIHSRYFYGQEKITVLLISLTMFMVFVKLKLKYHKWINVFASATFGVYLIHDHINVRTFLWLLLFKNASQKDSITLVPYSIIVVFLVYLSCTVIELIRQHTIEKLFLIFIERYGETWKCFLKKIVDRFNAIIFGDE